MTDPAIPHFDPVVVRGDEAEWIPEIAHLLLADATDTGGALSVHRIKLPPDADGALPHRHHASAELFFVLGGTLEVLVDDTVVETERGDLMIVPPGRTHAFRTHPHCSADALILVTPGIARFDYFRLLASVRRGETDAGSIRRSQQRFDTHFVDSPVWNGDQHSAPSSTRRS